MVALWANKPMTDKVNLPEIDVTFEWRNGKLIGRTVFMGRVMKVGFCPSLGGVHKGFYESVQKRMVHDLRLCARDRMVDIEAALE